MPVYVENMTTKTLKPQDATYWERVRIMAETDNQADIAWIMANECEDDFCLAIAGRKDATHEQLRWAYEQTGSLMVRDALLNNVLTPTDLVQTIRSEAIESIGLHADRARTVDPMQHHYQWVMEQNGKLVELAEQILESRGTR